MAALRDLAVIADWASPAICETRPLAETEAAGSEDVDGAAADTDTEAEADRQTDRPSDGPDERTISRANA
jgi:hypothetical protein